MKNDKVKAELDAILANLMTDKKMLQNDKRIIAVNGAKKQIAESNVRFHKKNPRTEEEKFACGNNMRGKTLEEILGEERAAAGKQARSNAHKGKNRPEEITQKIAATRRATGSYLLDTHGMNGKSHKESTKSIMSIKAEIRQKLKKQLGLGKTDKVPQELLAKAYKKAGLI
tara:strand:+ start:863 stop:1375 length:513 start_codon:yes stop_codon:yes gene_type:complete